jgi:8-oxo-dGTP diphosphatase
VSLVSFVSFVVRRLKLYCSECGSQMLLREIEGRERAVCPACGHVAYWQLKVGAGALVERDGALLLVQRGPAMDAFPGAWNLPSGYCEPGEPPARAAERETAEETGLQVRCGELVDAYYFDDDPRGSGLLLVYRAEIAGGELHGDGHEATAAGFFGPQELPWPLCGGGHDRAIDAWRARALDRWQPGEPLRYCPHCTHALEERPAFGRVRPVCVACGYVYFRDPKVGVSVLIEQEGRLLLVQRAIEPGLGQWCLPSGFVEWDEAPQAAAVRECAEETGLEVAIAGLLEANQYTADFRGPGINLTYLARVSGGHLRPGDDAGEARFFALSELPPDEQIAFASHRRAVSRWRVEIGG